jgi:hypothetical protein
MQLLATVETAVDVHHYWCPRCGVVKATVMDHGGNITSESFAVPMWMKEPTYYASLPGISACGEALRKKANAKITNRRTKMNLAMHEAVELPESLAIKYDHALRGAAPGEKPLIAACVQTEAIITLAAIFERIGISMDRIAGALETLSERN